VNRTIAIALGDNGRGLATLRYDVQGARENAAFEYDAGWLARNFIARAATVRSSMARSPTPNRTAGHAA